MTLVEMTISLAIVSLIAAGGYQMLVRTQKYAAQKKLTVSTQSEIDQLLAVIKKDWEYRSPGDGIVFPKTGHSRLTATSTACGLNTPCPKLRVWLKRNMNGTSITDVLTIENICVRPRDNAVAKAIALLNTGVKLDSNCSVCPKGDIPAVKIQGLDMATNKIVLASENRLFPQNAAIVDKVKTDGIVGMQACFTQSLDRGPIVVDVRALYRDQSGEGLKLIQKSQVYPFENFASIRLEQ